MNMKRLVIYFDGTSNKFGDKNTNVVKAFRVTSSSNQLKCYIPGVGSMKNKKYYFYTSRLIKKIAGLAFGYGLQERILEGYKFLAENYEEGDEIYFFGFSRGAYAAKVLAGLIHRCGLIGRHNEYLTQYAYNLYTARKPDFEVLGKFKSTFSKASPEITYMGLWDSVSSVGNIIQMRNYPDTSNVKNVSTLRHALAVDEKRFMFINNKSNSNKDNVQMWFPGVHSDVGGGHAEEESGLAKVPLTWILEEAEKLGLELNREDYNKYVKGEGGSDYVEPSATGKKHFNYWAWYALNLIPRLKTIGYNPRKYKFFIPFIRYREILKTDKVHSSVFERMDKIETYRPKNVAEWKNNYDL